MKNKIFLGVFLFLISISKLVHAQYVNYGIDKPAFERFEAAPTLYVVLTGHNVFDEALRDAISRYWKIKPYLFIDSSEAKKKLIDPTFCFLKIETKKIIVAYNSDIGGGSTDTYWGTNMGIFIGGPGSIEIDKGALARGYTAPGCEFVLAEAPFDAHGLNKNLDGTDKNIEDAIYKLPLMVKGFNDVLSFVKTNSLKGYGGIFRRKYCGQISANASILKNKTLLVLDSLNVITGKMERLHTTTVTKEIMQKYPYKYRYVTKAELDDLIKQRSKDYCFFDPCLSFNRHIIVYDLESLSLIYIKLETYLVKKGLTSFESFVYEDEIADLVSAINGKYKAD
ncbi:MAG TPA: hypothetical protein VE978_02100 [Chitinophagales bacterium]|nr:hypothetical protein [Chitinophagales bacterium]